MNISVVMDLIAQLGMKDEAVPVSKYPNGWERVVDEHWTICVNGGDSLLKWNGFEIPKFHCAVLFNGWPAGLVNPFSGTIAAGRVANEKALIEALECALAGEPTLGPS